MLVFTNSILSTAIRMTRYQYLKEKGFNGSTEGIPEKLKEVTGIVVTDSNNTKIWISEELYSEMYTTKSQLNSNNIN